MPETVIKVIQYTCAKCGHKWLPRRDQAPAVCPVCKRADWNGK